MSQAVCSGGEARIWLPSALLLFRRSTKSPNLANYFGCTGSFILAQLSLRTKELRLKIEEQPSVTLLPLTSTTLLPCHCFETREIFTAAIMNLFQIFGGKRRLEEKERQSVHGRRVSRSHSHPPKYFSEPSVLTNDESCSTVSSKSDIAPWRVGGFNIVLPASACSFFR